MRIISGKLRGIHMLAPANLPVRPTTDQAKESLFNILQNQFDFEDCEILDLFSGTGSVSIEFASRNASLVQSIDKHPGCIKWLEAVKNKYNLVQIQTLKADVFKYLEIYKKPYDIIFADPPYDLPTIPLIPKLVAENKLLKKDGVLIVEHPKFLKLHNLPGYTETRTYGYSAFSFFSEA